MVKPSQRKEIVSYLKKSYNVGFRLICELMSISRSAVYYESKRNDSELIEAIRTKVKNLPTWGFDEYYYRLHRDGYKWIRKRGLRVYREMGLVISWSLCS